MASVKTILDMLEAKADPDRLEGMSRFGMTVDKRLGVKVPDMRGIAAEVGKDHKLALDLWKTGYAEARIIASMIDLPGEVTEAQMEDWVKDFDSWDVCDQVCMNLFEKTPFVWKKIDEWSTRQEEFVKRTAYSLIACVAWHRKELGEERLVALIPLIKRGATDERNFVKKAVSWALRNIGKRSRNLSGIAMETAEEMKRMGSKSARWIASDVIRDLTKATTRRRLK
jgi:3-methyladenine DNA glycosylase AlkD